MEAQKRAGELWSYVEELRPVIERALAARLPCAPAHVDGRFNDALRYALFPGGKRLRPVLTVLGAELVGAESRAPVLRAAVAVEYVHTSSLIFDDLPCMDDAAERRGRASLHRRYGEGLAVLVALALLNASYGLIFDGDDVSRERAVSAHAELVACVGTQGMVTGQTLDILDAAPRPLKGASGNGKGNGARANVAGVEAGDGFAARVGANGYDAFRRDDYDAVRNLKTSALMRLALRLGAILSGARERQLDALSRFAELLGQAYQISDDVLDLAEDAALAAGGLRPSTLALKRGAHDARLRVASLVAQAKHVLADEFGPARPARLLGQVADYIATRKS
ncbi:MAG TPA: polyprenyl synthetase family protein [Pyrinomonadaceae bacterium]|nr:polyprenyl synthetase family protein [Pyrinomonadaceae bacterium]